MHNTTNIVKRRSSWYCAAIWLVAFVTTSCVFPQHYTIPEENRPGFNTGDRFIFKDNNTGLTDTLEVSVDFRKYLHNKEDYYDRILIEYTLLQNGKPAVPLFSFTQEIGLFMAQGPANMLLRADTVYADYTLPQGSVLHTVRRYIGINSTSSDFAELYYHHRNGVLKYVYKDGRTLEIQ